MKKKRPKTVGLLFSGLFDNYEMMLWKGVSEEIRQRGDNLVCYAGGALDSPYYYRNMRNILYDNVALEKIDGIIIFTAAVSNHITYDSLELFLKRFDGLPQVHVGISIPGESSVMVNNRQGMWNLLNHYICEHRCRNIAFLRGPETSSEAEDRYAAYLGILKEHDIPFQPDLVVDGDFHPFSAEKAVRQLFDQRKAKPDALICANDYTAIWALNELNNRGIQVPRDLLLGGFDDVYLARSSSPALTTVRQPLIQMGQEAVRLLENRLAGDPPEHSKIPTQLIIRESCGCDRGSWMLNQDDALLHLLESKKNGSKRMAYEFLNNHFPFSSGLEEELINPLFAAVEGKDDDTFISLLVDLLDNDITKENDLSERHSQINVLFSFLLKFGEMERDKDFLLELWNRSSLLVSHLIEEHVTFQRYQSEERSLTFHRLSQGIISALTMEQLEAAVKEGFPRLGIHKFWIVLYDNAGENTRESGRLLFSHSQTLTDNAEPFPLKNLLPESCISGQSYNFMVYALYFKEEHYGYVVLENIPLNNSVYESIPVLISGVLKSLGLYASVQEYASELETRVESRTRDLTVLNETLLKEVRERQKITEKLEHQNREVERLYRELQEKSKQDYLTSLYNRAAILGLLENEHRRARRQQRRKSSDELKGIFTVMMVDIDHFKRINDTYGHLAGDDVLRKLGEILTHEGILRQEDLAGRYGGEEFIIILPETTADQALLPAERISQIVRETVFTEQSRVPFHITLSVGISQFQEDDTNIEDIIQRADLALYKAKKDGRDRVVIYSQDIG